MQRQDSVKRAHSGVWEVPLLWCILVIKDNGDRIEGHCRLSRHNPSDIDADSILSSSIFVFVVTSESFGMCPPAAFRRSETRQL